MTVYSVVGSSVAKFDERGWPTIWAKGLRLRGYGLKLRVMRSGGLNPIWGFPKIGDL